MELSQVPGEEERAGGPGVNKMAMNHTICVPPQTEQCNNVTWKTLFAIHVCRFIYKLSSMLFLHAFTLRLRLDVGIGAEELHWASNAKTGWKWKYSSMPMLLFG